MLIFSVSFQLILSDVSEETHAFHGLSDVSEETHAFLPWIQLNLCGKFQLNLCGKFVNDYEFIYV